MYCDCKSHGHLYHNLQWTNIYNHRAKILRNLFLLISLAIFVWTILAVELTLFFNSVSGVYSIKSTGQLIPFIIGVFGVSKTVNSIMVRSIKEAGSRISLVSRNRANISVCHIAISQLAKDLHLGDRTK